ncbi:hypothetical protein [Gelatiniphilus marinus]|uniref:Uncharacterized protein n=1 Tax=Gelatiniphilus marinus TaxID=1759464 RepID=A0ABW5JS17_9FLAO
MNMQCEDNNDIVNLDCDLPVVIDKEKYDNLVSDNFTFISAEIIGDCISIAIAASGCDGDSWEYQLVDSGAIAETSIPQRDLKFQLINNEICEAYIVKTISFNLKPLQVDGDQEIILNIEGLESPFNYKY